VSRRAALHDPGRASACRGWCRSSTTRRTSWCTRRGRRARPRSCARWRSGSRRGPLCGGALLVRDRPAVRGRRGEGRAGAVVGDRARRGARPARGSCDRPRRRGRRGQLAAEQLTRWAQACPRPLVLVFDEIDALAGQPLLGAQPAPRRLSRGGPAFPWSVILCGMRDVRDYKAASGGGPVRMGSSSPFNIKEESLRLTSFTEAEVRELYAQHTADTGQAFTEEAIACVWTLTQGQPWLTNALAREVVEKIGVPPSEAITEAHILEAKERLILSRATHLDSLLARLREPAVRGCSSRCSRASCRGRDVRRRLRVRGGPGARVARGSRFASPTRSTARSSSACWRRQAEAAVPIEPRSYVGADGRLDVPRAARGLRPVLARARRGGGGPHRLPRGGAAARAHGVAAPHRQRWRRHRARGGRGPQADRPRGAVAPRRCEGERAVQRIAMELKVWRDRDKKGDPLERGLPSSTSTSAASGSTKGCW
jgi:hypothetical protein